MKHELVIGKYTLESLTNGMYASPLDMYREYIQNAVDSFDDAIESGLDFSDGRQPRRCALRSSSSDAAS